HEVGERGVAGQRGVNRRDDEIAQPSDGKPSISRPQPYRLVHAIKPRVASVPNSRRYSADRRRRTSAWPWAHLAQGLEGRPSREGGLRAQLFLDAQELIVLGGAIGPRQRTGLDLPAICGDGEVGDGGVLGLAGAVRHDRGVARLV